MLEVDDFTFEEEVLKSEEPVIVDMWAPWCGPCKAMTPILEEVSKKLNGVKFVKLNVDYSPQVTASYNVRSIPTFMVFKDGEVVDNVVGMVSEQDMLKIAERI